MSLFDAVVLAVLQGIAEFLPISSSGHLMLGGHFLGIREPKLLFDIILHVGTLVAVVVFYRKDIAAMLEGLATGFGAAMRTRDWREATAPEGVRLLILIVLATIPTGILGLPIDKLIDPEPGQAPVITPLVVSGLLVINGFILMAHRFLGRGEAPERQGHLTLWNITAGMAVVIGIAQGIAVLPGFSRAGLTITAAVAIGVSRVEAARFSFLLSIPAILGALVLKFDPAMFAGDDGLERMGVYLVGAVVASIVGYASLKVLVEMLRRAQFQHFAWYCWLVGATGLFLLWGT